jgi:hypothetical protein
MRTWRSSARAAAYEAKWTTRTKVREHAADESDRPAKLPQQRLISVNGTGAGPNGPSSLASTVLLSC